MGSVDKGKGLVIKGFPGMSKIIYRNSSKGYTVSILSYKGYIKNNP